MMTPNLDFWRMSMKKLENAALQLEAAYKLRVQMTLDQQATIDSLNERQVELMEEHEKLAKENKELKKEVLSWKAELDKAMLKASSYYNQLNSCESITD